MEYFVKLGKRNLFCQKRFFNTISAILIGILHSNLSNNNHISNKEILTKISLWGKITEHKCRTRNVKNHQLVTVLRITYSVSYIRISDELYSHYTSIQFLTDLDEYI